MKRFLMLFTIAITCFGLMATSAEARRLGGGGNFGKQRSVAPQQAPQRAPAATPAPAPGQNAAATPNRNKWLGPLAGLAIGAGLASLFAGTGMGGAMGSILLAILAAMAVLFVISRFMKPKPADMRYAGSGQAFDNASDSNSANSGQTGYAYQTANRDMASPAPTSTMQNSTVQNLNAYADAGNGAHAYKEAASSHIPADFPLESFLRGAKASYIRLQAANDRKDLDDIREYTTPEMFAEISMQLMERGDAMQKTDVISLDAELLEAVTEGDLAIASVRYTGRLAENRAAPEQVDEIWVVQRNTLNPKAGWLLAGIQQTQLH